MEISLKVQKYKDRIKISIPDKTVRDELSEKVSHNDIIIVEIKKIRKVGELLEGIDIK